MGQFCKLWMGVGGTNTPQNPCENNTAAACEGGESGALFAGGHQELQC